MRAFRYFFILILTGSLIVLQSLFAQDNLRGQLFNEADQLYAKAKEKKADLYAPASYTKAMNYYTDADEYYAKGKSLEDIREKLKNAAAYFAKALDACKVGEAKLAGAMAARSDAMSAGAQNYAKELWEKGESSLKKAARQYEDNDAESAQETSNESETAFRSAELEAIKANYLSPARELLRQADENGVRKNAPRTLEKAKNLSKEVEELLSRKRYDTDSARQLAQEAKYEAAHAIYLSEAVKKIDDLDQNSEDVLLEAERNFQRAATEAGIHARFDKGYDQPVADIKNALREREAKAAKNYDMYLNAVDSVRIANKTVEQREREINNLHQQISLMEKRLGSLTEAEQKLKQEGTELEQKLQTQLGQESAIRQVSGMFTSDEGNVLRDGSNIIIRLYGLTFPVGKSIIEQQFYPLLTKVQEAIKKFPKCQVAIEGHTDSQGSDDANQKLSGSRATAVAEYLMANMGVQVPISSQGYGESRPVASNDTPDGRAKNRRIDVVITPAWANESK